MNDIITPLSLLITALAGWLNKRHDKTIDFLCEEIDTYRAIVGLDAFHSQTTSDVASPCKVNPSVGNVSSSSRRWCSPTPYLVGIASWWLASTTTLIAAA
jgi:hypothetical protein